MRAAGPKIFIGYSDVTALHEAFAVRAGLATLHGPMAGEGLGNSLRQPGGPPPSICRFGRASRGAPTLSRHRCSDAAGAQIHHTQIHQVKSGGRFGYGGSAAGQDMSKG